MAATIMRRTSRPREERRRDQRRLGEQEEEREWKEEEEEEAEEEEEREDLRYCFVTFILLIASFRSSFCFSPFKEEQLLQDCEGRVEQGEGGPESTFLTEIEEIVQCICVFLSSL